MGVGLKKRVGWANAPCASSSPQTSGAQLRVRRSLQGRASAATRGTEIARGRAVLPEATPTQGASEPLRFFSVPEVRVRESVSGAETPP